MKKNGQQMDRRHFLRQLGIGAGSAVAMMALDPFTAFANKSQISNLR